MKLIFVAALLAIQLVSAAAESRPATNSPPFKFWKIYKHPTGLSISYPEDWKLQPFAQGLQLIPPDARSNEKGPTELYMIMAEGAPGVASAESPEVLSYIESQLLAQAPFFKRAGEIEKIRVAGVPAIIVTWEGTNPDGQKVQANAFSIVLKGYGISVIALGETKLVKAREKTLRGIFTSIATGEGQRDPQLVGSWKFWSYSSSADGKFGTERTRFITVQADGTVISKGRAESSGTVSGKDSLGNQTFAAGVAGQSSDGDSGTWSAANGQVFVRWQDGSVAEWTYKVAGEPGNRRLFLQDATQTKPDEWVETK